MLRVPRSPRRSREAAARWVRLLICAALVLALALAVLLRAARPRQAQAESGTPEWERTTRHLRARELLLRRNSARLVFVTASEVCIAPQCCCRGSACQVSPADPCSVLQETQRRVCHLARAAGELVQCEPEGLAGAIHGGQGDASLAEQCRALRSSPATALVLLRRGRDPAPESVYLEHRAVHIAVAEAPARQRWWRRAPATPALTPQLPSFDLVLRSDALESDLRGVAARTGWWSAEGAQAAGAAERLAVPSPRAPVAVCSSLSGPLLPDGLPPGSGADGGGGGDDQPVIALCLAVREGAPFLDEWLRFHLAAGAHRAYIHDDGSVDGTQAVLRAWSAFSAFVTPLADVHGPTRFRIAQRTTAGGWSGQREVLGRCLTHALLDGVDWLLAADLDEYMLPKMPARSLGEALRPLSAAVCATVRRHGAFSPVQHSTFLAPPSGAALCARALPLTRAPPPQLSTATTAAQRRRRLAGTDVATPPRPATACPRRGPASCAPSCAARAPFPWRSRARRATPNGRSTCVAPPRPWRLGGPTQSRRRCTTSGTVPPAPPALRSRSCSGRV